MFAAFTRPNRLILALAAAAHLTVVPFTRFVAGDGGFWTLFGLALTFAAFVTTASHYSALRQLGLPARRWLAAAAGCGALWTDTTASLVTLSAVLMHRRNIYYAWYDWFLVTSGDAHTHDSSGAPHVAEGFGMTAGSIAWTWLTVAGAFLLAVVCGLGFALARNRAVLVALTAASVIAGVCIVVAAQAWWLTYHATYVDGVPLPLDGPHSHLAGGRRAGFVLLLGAVPLVGSLVRLYRALSPAAPADAPLHIAR